MFEGPMALTGEQVLSMTPEDIANLMSEDITVNNGLKEIAESSPLYRMVKPRKPLKVPPSEYIHEQDRRLFEYEYRYRIIKENWEVPTTIPILPPKAYIQPIRPPAPKPPQPAKTGFCKRMIII
jgi:hypothetical protein